MASALQKLFRKPPSSRFITAFHPSQQSNPIIPFHREHDPLKERFQKNPILTHQFIGSSSSSLIFPSFPFGFASKPVLENGFLSPDVGDSGFGDSGTLWADSVKKKRKKKMNKHKYQKLRKRMRKQT